MKALLALIALSFTLSACHTLVLNKGADIQPRYETENFHHIGIVRLVEFSDPVDPRKSCEGGQWDSVQTRRGALHVLIGVLSGPFYHPEEVSVSCKK